MLEYMLKDTKESLNTDKFLQIHNIHVIDPRRDMNSFHESSRMFIQIEEKKADYQWITNYHAQTLINHDSRYRTDSSSYTSPVMH